MSVVHLLAVFRQYVNSKVDSSIDQQLDDLRRIFLTPNGVFKKDTQAIELIDFFATDL